MLDFDHFLWYNGSNVWSLWEQGLCHEVNFKNIKKIIFFAFRGCNRVIFYGSIISVMRDYAERIMDEIDSLVEKHNWQAANEVFGNQEFWDFVWGPMDDGGCHSPESIRKTLEFYYLQTVVRIHEESGEHGEEATEARRQIKEVEIREAVRMAFLYPEQTKNPSRRRMGPRRRKK